MRDINFDVDIDVFKRDEILSLIDHTSAKLTSGKKHNTGIYIQDINSDITGLATIDHKEAEKLGYLKIDILNNSAYEGVKDMEHLKKLCNSEPRWDLLEHEEFITKLFHISSYSELVKFHKPKNVEQLAMLLAIIRPSKKHLQYKSWEEIKKTVWEKGGDGYYFKKSHSIAYAMVIVVQMNVIVEMLLF